MSNKKYFTLDEIKRVIDDISSYHSLSSKIIQYKSTHEPDNIVRFSSNPNFNTYNEVFITSDIHADYRKFVQILVTGGFIRIPDVGDLYEGNNIYNPRIISDCEWIKGECLVIIAGDLVDGNRNNAGSVDDNLGQFELLLHLLIFNLRIKGEDKKSNILFTIGNHDLESVIFNSDLLKDYVHESSKVFFRDNVLRRTVLSMFYELNPYIYIVLSASQGSGYKNEVAILHGGLHDSNGELFNSIKELQIKQSLGVSTIRKPLEDLQYHINMTGLKHLIHVHNLMVKGHYANQTPSAYKMEDNPRYDGALWTRFYAENPDKCDLNYEYSLTVVGHCPTTMFSQLSSILDKPEYNGCDQYKENKTKGCVILNCLEKPDAAGLPRIALVDVSLSSAFNKSLGRKDDQDKNRGVELLHLQHTSASSTRWFNDISRFEINFVNNTTHDIRPSQTGGGKNYKEKYMIYKMKYLSLKAQV